MECRCRPCFSLRIKSVFAKLFNAEFHLYSVAETHTVLYYSFVHSRLMWFRSGTVYSPEYYEGTDEKQKLATRVIHNVVYNEVVNASLTTSCQFFQNSIHVPLWDQFSAKFISLHMDYKLWKKGGGILIVIMTIITMCTLLALLPLCFPKLWNDFTYLWKSTNDKVIHKKSLTKKIFLGKLNLSMSIISWGFFMTFLLDFRFFDFPVFSCGVLLAKSAPG
jgi:hypothetical protein